MRQISTLFILLSISIGLVLGCDGEKPAAVGPALVDPSANTTDSTSGSGKKATGSDTKDDEGESEGESE